MIHFSECVSPGHPDKICDFITSYILDQYMKKDPSTRYAVEVQMKNNVVTLGGEVSSKCHFDKDEIEQFVKNAVNEIGYTKEYQTIWGKENTICGDDLVVNQIISQQSPEIAQGVDNDGWGDQGIFFGMCKYYPNKKDRDLYCGLPKDFALAKMLNQKLFTSGIGGLDIKTEIIYDEDIDKILKCIVAIPLLDKSYAISVENLIKTEFEDIEAFNNPEMELIINGTDSYRQHSTIADCGTTGRKLAVDFYGGNCKIGGGCVSGDTEYLSPTGWKKISEYKGGKVAQIDEDFDVTFVTPERYIHTFTEEVYKIGNGKNLEMILSANHNVVYKTSKGHYRKMQLSDILEMQKVASKGVHHEIPLFFRYEFNNGVKRYDEWMTRLIVAHCADGTVLDQKNWNGRIRVKKQYKVERLRTILGNVKIMHEERDYHDGFKYFYYKLDDTSKLLSEQFANCDKETAAIISSEVFWWDGDHNARVFRTTHKEDADFVQFVEMALSGDAYTIATHKFNDDLHKRDIYIVYKNKRHFTSPFRKNEDTVNPISKQAPQDVYCFTVRTGMLILRYNNKVFVTGNSPWTKDGTKADVALNLYARKLARKLSHYMEKDVYISLACCIGKPTVDCTIFSNRPVFDQHSSDFLDVWKQEIDVYELPQSQVVKELGLDKPIYGSMCNYGLFGQFQKDKNWENDLSCKSIETIK